MRHFVINITIIYKRIDARPPRITAVQLYIYVYIKQVPFNAQEISLNLTGHQSVLIKENACHSRRCGNWHDTRAQLVA